MTHRLRAVVLAVAVALGALCAGGTARADGCRPDRVALRGSKAVVSFNVEVAQTAAARQRGLMGRRSLAPDAGMLFVYPAPQPVLFWMHDTLIPLDMLFFDAQGRLTRVKADARPLDETPINGGDAVLAVLEINAGLAARLGLAPGAVMRSAVFVQAQAAWPCDAD